MSAGERLTENIRVRLSASEREELERLAQAEDRSASSVARRAIRRELERAAAGSSGRS
jgi:predicted transcriptional regulator